MENPNRILIINKNDSFAKELKKDIVKLGYSVAGVISDVDDIIDFVEKNQIDLALLNIEIDDVKENKSIGYVLNNKLNLPFIYMFSNYDPVLVNNVKKNDPFGYLFKPVGIEDLHTTLEIACNRIRLYKALHINEKKYRILFEESKDAIFIVDSNANIINYNKSMLQQFGYDSSDMLNITFNDLFLDMDEVVNIYSLLESDSYVKDREVVLKKKNSEKIDGLLSASLVDSSRLSGNIYEYILKEITHINERNIREIEKSYEQLKNVTEGIIEAISLMVSMRDPYTSGHQQKVTDIAVRIAHKMGFDDNRIEGMRIASLLHDIGKLSIPAEILSKPAKLNKYEFDLIKFHPEQGYEILKNIDFPWDIAKIVHQHHERIDGSGYPMGLKGNEILLESKIIAVADVLEAMSSHRPYRASLGMDYAIEEILRYKGVWYDEVVVETAILVISEMEKNSNLF